MVTPAMAANMLTRNRCNRKLRPDWVKQLVGRIRRGEWKLTHQGIALSDENILLDGQHRLLAIVEANTSLPLMVTTGMGGDVYDTLDDGAKRNLSDHTKWNARTAEAVRFVTRIVMSTSSPSAAQCRTVGEPAFAALHEELRTYSSTNLAYYSTAPVRSAAVVLVMLGTAKPYVFGAYQALVSQQFDSLPAIAHSLIRQVTNKTATSGAPTDVLAKALKVLNPHYAGTRRLKTSPEDVAAALTTVRCAFLK
jgi:hypothetical protein